MANTHTASKRKVTYDDNSNEERPQKKSNRKMTTVLPEHQVTPRMEDRDDLYHNDDVVEVDARPTTHSQTLVDGTSKKPTKSADAELGKVLQTTLVSPSDE